MGLAVLVVGYGSVSVLAGAADSPLVPELPPGVRKPGWSTRLAEGIGLSHLSRTAQTFVALALIAVLLGAFVLVVVEAWRGRLEVRLALAATAAALAVVTIGPLLLSRDAYSYAAYGRIWVLHGANPYVVPPSAFPPDADPFIAVASREWLGTPSVYGPVFTLLSGGMARMVAASPAATIVAFKSLAAISVGLATMAAALAARVARPGREALAAVAVGVNPVLVVHTVGGGHNDALVGFLLAAGLLAAVWSEERGRGALVATALLTLAVLVKAVVVPVLILWLWRVVRRRPTGATGTELASHAVVALGLMVAAFVPFVSGWSTFRALLSVASRQGWASGTGLVVRGARGLGNVVAGHSTGTTLDILASAMFVALFAVLFVGLLVRADRLPLGDLFGRGVLALVLTAPYLLPWYAAWFAPFVALIEDGVLAAIGLAAMALLAVTGVPTEPGSTPVLWRHMLLAVHYVAAPLTLGLLAAALWRWNRSLGSPRRDQTAGAIATSRMPTARA